MAHRRIDVDAVERALAGKRLGVGAFVARVTEPVCRCAAGELAHVAGVTDATLVRIDSECTGSVDANLQAWRDVKRALKRKYGITKDDLDRITEANDDARGDSDARRAAVLLECRKINTELEQGAWQ